MTAAPFRAGAARIDVTPAPGLHMVGFVRRHAPATTVAHPLEVTALALEQGDERALIVGVDTLGIQAPEVDVLRDRVARAAGARREAVLLNWNHTHCAPAGGRTVTNLGGDMEAGPSDRDLDYVDHLHDAVVEVAQAAAGRLEPAAVAWGLGALDENVNRRERAPDGRMILGWNPDGIVDRQVAVMQARRPDGSAVGTVIGWGCHTVTVGPDVLAYSADFPGPMREAVRDWTGGECVFVQGAAGNVLPRVGFAGPSEADRLGRLLALEALHAVTGRDAWPRRVTRRDDGSVTPIALYRMEPDDARPPALAAAEERVRLPLLPLPASGEITALREVFEEELAAARAAGADEGRLNTIRYGLNWARAAEEEIHAGAPRTAVEAPVTALRIGDGVIVTGPGEVSSEIGMAVRERSPAAVTMYAGYTNGAVSYLPAAASYPEGGYEPGYGNRSYGLPAPVSPECDRILVEAGVRLARRLFPEVVARGPDGWLATGAPVPPPPARTWERPPPA